MKLGFIIPHYPYEKRVALLPEHINNFKNELYIEAGFGINLDIDDEQYIEKGCIIENREHIFKYCDAIFCLKLLQPSDYEYIRENQMVIGWSHPSGSGEKFMVNQAFPKQLKIVDIDNIYPAVYYNGKKFPINFIPRNFIKKNSYLAGYAATLHALMNYGMMPDSNTQVAILSSGNVSQGSFNAISKFTSNIELFYRKTMDEFYGKLGDYDIIINGIEIDDISKHILTKAQLKELKPSTLIIDAAADAGNAIEGTHYTTLDDPLYKENGRYFYEINNAPTLLFREASYEISKSFSKYIFKEDVDIFLKLINATN